MPGVYVYRNSGGEVIYVGKARNLRSRMCSYFQPSGAMQSDPRRRALIHSIASYEIFPVETEQEALLLEDRFIKQYNPRYNVDLRDDKRYLHVCIDPTETFPRLQTARLRREDGRHPAEVRMDDAATDESLVVMTEVHERRARARSGGSVQIVVNDATRTHVGM